MTRHYGLYSYLTCTSCKFTSNNFEQFVTDNQFFPVCNNCYEMEAVREQHDIDRAERVAYAVNSDYLD